MSDRECLASQNMDLTRGYAKKNNTHGGIRYGEGNLSRYPTDK